jgi:hypothetical protein
MSITTIVRRQYSRVPGWLRKALRIADQILGYALALTAAALVITWLGTGIWARVLAAAVFVLLPLSPEVNQWLVRLARRTGGKRGTS